MAKMSMQFGLEKGHCKRAFRWLFSIPDVTPDESSNEGAKVLPPSKAARPNLQFKEMNVNHLIEEVFYPAKPDWKPVSLTLYDLKVDPHPVFKWVRQFYQPQYGNLYAPNEKNFIKEATLTMYDGCGEQVEQWIYEDAWLQNVDFQSLDMADPNLVMCEITLRYARAYVLDYETITGRDPEVVDDRQLSYR